MLEIYISTVWISLVIYLTQEWEEYVYDKELYKHNFRLKEHAVILFMFIPILNTTALVSYGLWEFFQTNIGMKVKKAFNNWRYK